MVGEKNLSKIVDPIANINNPLWPGGVETFYTVNEVPYDKTNYKSLVEQTSEEFLELKKDNKPSSVYETLNSSVNLLSGMIQKYFRSL